MQVFLKFLSNGEGLTHFLWQVLPKLSKITVTCPKYEKGPNKINFDLPKVSEVNINFELLKVIKMASLKSYISSHREARNIKCEHHININWKSSTGCAASGGSDVISS